MAKIKSEYLVPRLRQIVKKTIKKHSGCKRFRVLEGSTALLPVESTIQTLTFNIISIDYAGSLICKKRGAKKLRCAYYLHAV